MNPDFWLQRWQDRQIGFHQDTPTPLMQTYWPALQAPVGCRVFVPLAGKTLDMLWLAAQGHDVLGVELAPLAVEEFFAEHALRPEIFDSRYGRHYRVEMHGRTLELICGDAFALDTEILADCAAVLDRAALIALPAGMRQTYASALYASLPYDCRTLLITLEYPQHEKSGPPFSVDEAEVRALYGLDWDIDLLERSDILADQPGFIAEGVTALDTCVYRLSRRDA